ncbi:hypothetical protein FACS189454_10110 [Planctomycetales bacterium]|nr:hypothetical protein FACS189454_10110 [Planctomycetales bacterium]
MQRFISSYKAVPMERWHRAFVKNDMEFKELFGVKKETFHHMLAVLSVAYQERHRKGVRRPKLSVGDQLFLTLQYWREYRTMSHLAFDFGVAKSTVSDTILLVENALIQNGTFHLPGKKALLSKENAGRTLAVDVTESPIERPKKNRKNGIQARKSGTQ